MELTYELFRSFLRREGCEEAFDRNFEAYHPGYVMDAGYSGGCSAGTPPRKVGITGKELQTSGGN